MIEAYVLIQTEVGKAKVVVDEVRLIDGITSADDVTGPYDVIVRAEADDVDELGPAGRCPDPGHQRHHPNPHLPHRPPLNRPSRPLSGTGFTPRQVV